MVLGEMKMVSGPFGPDSACVPYEDQALGDVLSAAVQNIHADYTAIDLEEVTDEEADLAIPADPNVRNYSYTLVDGKLYYRQNSIMKPVDVSLIFDSNQKLCCTELVYHYTPDDMLNFEQDMSKVQYEVDHRMRMNVLFSLYAKIADKLGYKRYYVMRLGTAEDTQLVVQEFYRTKAYD